MPYTVGEKIQQETQTYECVELFERPYARFRFNCLTCGTKALTTAPADVPIRKFTMRCAECIALKRWPPAMPRIVEAEKPEPGMPKYADTLLDILSRAALGLHPRLPIGRLDTVEVRLAWRNETNAYPTKDYNTNCRNQFRKILDYLTERGLIELRADGEAISLKGPNQ